MGEKIINDPDISEVIRSGNGKVKDQIF